MCIFSYHTHACVKLMKVAESFGKDHETSFERMYVLERSRSRSMGSISVVRRDIELATLGY